MENLRTIAQPVTLVFDIGKTNKKCFLFDADYREVYRAYRNFPEITDEDGFPCDDLEAIVSWMKRTFNKLLKKEQFSIEAVNFSTYGATLVHLGEDGKVLTPLYNYLKPYPVKVRREFRREFGSAEQLAVATASPPAGMLNAGFQLYWLKKTQPKTFRKVRYSLHLPQYLSYLFTGVPLSDFTSVGCHTSLWDYRQRDYHEWTRVANVEAKLPAMAAATTSINLRIKGRKLKVGIGIHDSSAALLPYLLAESKPFLLVSTGTWSISLNPFSRKALSKSDLAAGCLNYLRVDGKAVRAARLFLGREYAEQVAALARYFGKNKNAHRKVSYRADLQGPAGQQLEYSFRMNHLSRKRGNPAKTDYGAFRNFTVAYHQLMAELVELQVEAIRLAQGKSRIKKIFLDGGFTDNEVFVQLLARALPEHKLRVTKASLGSALGAAMVISSEPLHKHFLKRQYGMRKVMG